MPYTENGIYEHYKGGRYEVLGLALRENSINKDVDDGGIGERFVIYRPLSPHTLLKTPDYVDCAFWARRLDDFNEDVPDATMGSGYYMVPRFQLIRASA